MEWVASLGVRGLQPKTIKGYLSSVRSLHVDCDLPFEACQAPVVQRLLRGIKRFHGERERNPKMPITLQTLRSACWHLAESITLHDHTIKAAMAVAFAGFLRCGEFTLGRNEKFNPAIHLTRSHVKFVPDMQNATHALLSLPASKTDPFRRGVTIVLAAVPSAITCPVAALREMINGDHSHSLTELSPLFPGTEPGSALTRDTFISRLKSVLTALGLDSAAYSGHSFRRGAATSAAVAGYSDHEIQQLGRWRSDAYKLYIDLPADRILHLSSRLHWAEAEPHAQPYEPPALPFAPLALA